MLGSKGCSTLGWFCLSGQRCLLLEENPQAFDLRLQVSLSHLEREMYRHGSLGTFQPFPIKGLVPTFPSLSSATTYSQPKLAFLPALVISLWPPRRFAIKCLPLRWGPWPVGSHTRHGSPPLYTHNKPPNQTQGIELTPSPSTLCLPHNRNCY